MRREFALKMSAWFADGVVGWGDIERAVAVVDGKERGRKSASALKAEQTGLESQGKRPPEWAATCCCGRSVGPMDMQVTVGCAKLVSR